MAKLDRKQGLRFNLQGHMLLKVLAMTFAFVLAACSAKAQVKSQQKEEESRVQSTSIQQVQSAQIAKPPRRFFDKTNILLFTGVAAVRTLDYTSTQHFRNLGDNEVLLSNSIVDNKPLFAGIEVAGTALSIGVSYLFYRTGHYKLERWVSIIHIGVGTFGDIRNYSLGPPK